MRKDVNKKRNILNRYGFVVALMLLFGGLILFYAAKIIFTPEGKKWREVGEKETVIRDRVILPTRGNIFTHNGKLLASSEPLYGIYMDFWAEGMKKDTLIKYVEPLSKSLATMFPDRSAGQYRSIMLNAYKQKENEQQQIASNKAKGVDKKVKIRTRYVRLIKRDISYIELKEIRKLPFLNQKSNRSGMIAEEKNSRKKPFGSLATRTVGSIYRDMSMGGASGLELKFDSLLRGVPGVKNRQKIQGKWMDVVEIPAQDGYDILTTLDADIQDISERALRNKLIEIDAESGCAVIMEVKTGEIKGIVNLDRLRTGVYAEGNPNVFSYMNEPGSTFKTVTVLAALEDGAITPTDSFLVGNGLYTHNRRVVRDHYWTRGEDKGYLTVKEGMEISSNIVMTKIALKAYEDNPEKFINRIDKMGLTRSLQWDVPLKGIEGTSQIRHPKDKANPWSKTTLAWMSFGYESQVPPIYLLMFYNALANNGKMIKPFIAKELYKDGKLTKEFEAEVVNSSIASKKSIDMVHDMLLGVIENGTAKVVKSEYFPIAGKTGTAQIASGGGYSGHFVSFCGYFPADDPKYTCFVGIRKPKGIPSGGGMAGMVFKNIAEQTFVKNTRMMVDDCRIDSTLSKLPTIKSGLWSKNKLVLKELGYAPKAPEKNVEWVQIKNDSNAFVPQKLTLIENLVPNVTGMGARDAIYLLEKSGLRVNLSGSGKVVSQSYMPGRKIVKGTTIGLVLQ
ncbi:MAG: penicillin-binding protein [Dysgonamonadaceae bacterium]|nr:penicillin-binding protein [Dysgonamonadaceae bacterium]MDD4728799.1 penicillin-binding protein [Dysgonamonadaceae bacterium]